MTLLSFALQYTGCGIGGGHVQVIFIVCVRLENMIFLLSMVQPQHPQITAVLCIVFLKTLLNFFYDFFPQNRSKHPPNASLFFIRVDFSARVFNNKTKTGPERNYVFNHIIQYLNSLFIFKYILLLEWRKLTRDKPFRTRTFTRIATPSRCSSTFERVIIIFSSYQH